MAYSLRLTVISLQLTAYRLQGDGANRTNRTYGTDEIMKKNKIWIISL